jgi:hypothetical protein
MAAVSVTGMRRLRGGSNRSSRSSDAVTVLGLQLSLVFISLSLKLSFLLPQAFKLVLLALRRSRRWGSHLVGAAAIAVQVTAVVEVKIMRSERSGMLHRCSDVMSS